MKIKISFKITISSVTDTDKLKELLFLKIMGNKFVILAWIRILNFIVI